MKITLGVCLLVLATAVMAGAQESGKPILRPGISVQMVTETHATMMPGADAEDATVVTITREGRLFLGTDEVEARELTSLKTGTIYVKVDAGAPFQNVLNVLDTLWVRSVVLLTAPAVRANNGAMMQSYGLELSLGQ